MCVTLTMFGCSNLASPNHRDVSAIEQKHTYKRLFACWWYNCLHKKKKGLKSPFYSKLILCCLIVHPNLVSHHSEGIRTLVGLFAKSLKKDTTHRWMMPSVLGYNVNSCHLPLSSHPSFLLLVKCAVSPRRLRL